MGQPAVLVRIIETFKTNTCCISEKFMHYPTPIGPFSYARYKLILIIRISRVGCSGFQCSGSFRPRDRSERNSRLWTVRWIPVNSLLRNPVRCFCTCQQQPTKESSLYIHTLITALLRRKTNSTGTFPYFFGVCAQRTQRSWPVIPTPDWAT